MRHTRFELGFPRHRKVHRLSDAAFRLWTSAIDYAREQRTDGKIDENDLAAIPRGAVGGTWRATVVSELVTIGLWDRVGDGWQIHDFLVWQDSREEVDRAREKARERMNVVRANNKRTSEKVPPGTSDSHSDSDSDPESNKTPKRNRKPRDPAWTRFPQDYVPDTEDRELAAERGVDFAMEFAAIRDWEFRTPRRDPKATLRTWLRRATPTMAPRRKPAGAQSGEDPAARKARLEAEEAERHRRELHGGDPPSGTVEAAKAIVRKATGSLF